MAISGEMPRFAFTSSDSVVRVTPSAAAASVMLKPKGSMHWRKTKPPGCGGFFIGMAVSSGNFAQPFQPRGEVGLQVVDIFEADMEADERALEFLRERPVIVCRQDQALEPAPGIAQAEMLHAVEHGGNGLVARFMQHNAEQA